MTDGCDGCELFGGGPSTEIVVVVAGGDELGEQAADVGPAGRVHFGVELFGAAGKGTADPAELAVLGRGDRGVGPVARRAQ